MPSTDHRGARGLFLAAMLCVAAVVALAVLVSLGATRPVDVAIIDVVRASGSPLGFLAAVTSLGATPWITAMALLVLLVELAARRPWLGIAAAATIGVASLLDAGAKDLVRRARPDLLPPLEIEPGFSFPSGHSMLSTVAYGILILLIWHGPMPRALRLAGVTALTALIFLIGLSRVYLGVHFPSDVLGGWLGGAAVVLLFEALVRSRLAPRVSREASTAPGAPAAAGDPAAPRSDPPERG